MGLRGRIFHGDVYGSAASSWRKIKLFFLDVPVNVEVKVMKPLGSDTLFSNEHEHSYTRRFKLEKETATLGNLVEVLEEMTRTPVAEHMLRERTQYFRLVVLNQGAIAFMIHLNLVATFALIPGSMILLFGKLETFALLGLASFICQLWRGRSGVVSASLRGLAIVAQKLLHRVGSDLPTRIGIAASCVVSLALTICLWATIGAPPLFMVIVVIINFVLDYA
ncbi:hypothetical protein LTR37_017966 [Vermiconidia calcicola]|uniref:Uncharacterized protein n=1 Tax=Vermiconidia calcicola TaxID=1690605 RepID=A0ACC3MJF8_9PEZI|nr:hypothetical protein LTR37_017966 [Vermiconidia calcicola]